MSRNYLKVMSLASILILLCVQIANANDLNNVKGGDFEISYHEPVPPINLLRKPFDPSSPDGEGPSWEWVLEAFGKLFHFDLQPNDRVIAGLPKGQREKIAETVKLYRGKIQGNEDSWIRLTKIGDEWSGMFWDGEEVYIIDPLHILSPFLRVIPFVGEFKQSIYRLSDTKNLEQFVCGFESTDASGQPPSDFQALSQELQGEVSAEAVGASLNIDLAIVTDPLFAQIQQNSFQTSNDAAVVARVNVADGIYSEQVGVQINLVEILELSDNGSLTSTDSATLLSQFGNFTNSSQFNHPGVAHLFTGRDLNGSVIGRAYLSSLCHDRYGVGINEIRQGGTVGAILFAHELGHNFGAPHDNQSGSACSSTPSGFIMNPFLDRNSQDFSECSIEQMQPEINSASCITDIDSPVSSVTLEADKPSPAQLATVGTVTFTANAMGGSGNYDYRFIVRDPFGVWTEGQDFGNGNIFAWTPPDVGSWAIQVRARNVDSTELWEALTGRIFEVLGNSPVSSVTLDANKPSPAYLATVGTVTFTANAMGGSGNYDYRFIVRDPFGVWTEGQDFGNGNIFAWTPPDVGRWVIQVRARNVGSAALWEALAGRIFDISGGQPVSSVTLNANKPSPAQLATVGTVTFIANAMGGSGNYDYRFIVRDPFGVWTEGQDFGNGNTFAWTPPDVGSWAIQVRARNVGSTVLYDVLDGMVFVILDQ